MALSTPIPTKYEEETLADLRALSDHFGLPISALIRTAVRSKVLDWKRGEQFMTAPTAQNRTRRPRA